MKNIVSILLILFLCFSVSCNKQKSNNDSFDDEVKTEVPIKDTFFGGVKFGMSKDSIFKILLDEKNLDAISFWCQI